MKNEAHVQTPTSGSAALIFFHQTHTRFNSNYTYLLVFWGGLKNVIHQHGHQFRHSVNSSGICAILGRAVYRLALRLCLLKPLAGYRVYYVEDPQFVCSGSFLEVCVNFLDEDGFGLQGSEVSKTKATLEQHA